MIMAFMNNNNGGFNNNNGGETKKKSNFKVGTIYGEDGKLNISTWNSDKGSTFAVVSIVAMVGKDPATGAPVYQQKMSGELPSAFFNIAALEAAIGILKKADPSNINFTLDCGRSKISVVGSGSKVTITVNSQKNGEAKITFGSVNVGNVVVFPEYNLLWKYLEVCFKKAFFKKLDPDEFSSVMSSEDPSEDSPF
jgi:hypothetical protein